MPVWFWGLGRWVPPSHPDLGCLHGCLPSSALPSAGLPWLMGCGVWPGDGQGLSLCCLPPPTLRRGISWKPHRGVSECVLRDPGRPEPCSPTKAGRGPS